jgi:hypothetical protein
MALVMPFSFILYGTITITERNELVDREAKEAAKGHPSDMKLLPHYLRKPILTNSSALKKAHNKSLTKEW